jgi:hypothetical protein
LTGINNLKVERVLFYGHARGLDIVRGIFSVVSQSVFWNSTIEAIRIANSCNSDQGDNVITHSVFSGAAVGLNLQAGGMSFLGNKMLSGTFPIVVDLGTLNANTANLQVANNSIEGYSNAGIFLERTSGAFTFANVTIVGNEFASTTAAGRYGVLIGSTASTGALNVSITGNAFRSLDVGVALDAGTGIIVGDNTFDTINTGIGVSTAGTVTVGPNRMNSVTAPITGTAVATTWSLAVPVTNVQLPAGGANGSVLPCPTCTVASCGTAGSGALAFRAGGAWVCK